MSDNSEQLFSNSDLSDYLRRCDAALCDEIDKFTSDYVLKVSLDDLVQHLTEKYRLEPVVLLPDQIQIGDHGDTQVDVSGDFRYAYVSGNRVPATFAEFVVPFTGEVSLLRLKPSQYTTSRPCARIFENELHFRFVRIEDDATSMRADFDGELKKVTQYLVWSRQQVDPHNNGLAERIRQRLNERKVKFLKDKGLVEGLGYPIKPRGGVSQTYPAPVVRKKLPIPTVSPGPFRSDPVLEMEHYDHILNVISHLNLVMERSPHEFAKMQEETLRSHILVQLNGHYEQQATGETFNGEGKTDILIRVEGRNIFVAECKFWKGAAVFKETIDQLLGYTAWRDTKTAIIVFNRNRDTSAVLKQIPDLVKGHPNFKREVTSYKNESSFRFVLHHRDDRNRELTLTVLVFDVPT